MAPDDSTAAGTPPSTRSGSHLAPDGKKRGTAKTVFFSVLALCLGLAVGLGLMLWAAMANLLPIGTETVSRDTQVATAIERKQQVVLMSLGVQGITSQKITSTFLGHDVPGTGRALFLQYTYNAKLGIDGQDVRIKPLGEDSYEITIPPFMFIGHDDVTFETAVENNGIISWVTPEVDTAALATQVLSQESFGKHINANRDLLQSQAEAFYTGIVHGIDPTLKLTFKFEGGQR